MPAFLLHHQHEPSECAAWHGFASPLRHGRVASTCLAERTTPIEVREVQIP